MNIEYAIEETGSKGRGIISKQFVKAGDAIWILAHDTTIVAVDDNDLEVYLKSKSAEDVEDILSHGFCTGDTFIDLQFSQAGMMNHSFNPNTKFIEAEGRSIALCDIQVNEELTESYWSFALPPNYDRLMMQYLGGNCRDHSKDWH